MRIPAACLYVGIKHVLAVVCLRLEHVCRVAIERIRGGLGEHTAHKGAGDHLMKELCGQRRRDELIMHALVDHFLALLCGIALLAKADGRPWMAKDGIDLVEREPVLHEMAIALEARPAKAEEQVDDPPVVPAVEVIGEVDRLLVVVQRHEWLDALFLHVGKNVFVELETRLERLFLGSCGTESVRLARRCGSAHTATRDPRWVRFAETGGWRMRRLEW